MNEELKQIGERIRSLRDIFCVSVATLAEEIGLTQNELEDFESGAKDIPIGVLHSIAKRFGVGLNSLLTGEEGHLTQYCLTRRDGGVAIERRPDYEYRSLAFTFFARKADPFLVTVEPKTGAEDISLNRHAGQEFDYVLSGTLMVRLGETDFILHEGDSLYYNSEIPHGMKALEGTSARFLACIF